MTATATSGVLTTQEFTTAVHAISPKVAVFDCDGTLWPGDSGSGFMNWSIETGLLSRESSDWLDARHRAYRRGEVSELAICGEMVQIYRGQQEREIRNSAREFFRTQIEKTIFPEMLSLIQALQAGGTDIWAVSSTCDWVVEEGVKRFGIPASRVLAACVEVSHGVVTNTLRDVPTDEGKVAAIQRVGLQPDAVFGNSVHDAAMLAVARRAFPVNPTLALLDVSTLRGWPVYYPAAVSPTSLPQR